jgi:NAD(P)-dependent dehydrogenase (short-subunit alcohol dehydrogenase family)
VDLQNTAALITGGRRIGAVVAAQLAARGADVALGYAHSREGAEEGARAVRACGRRAAVLEADLSEPAGCDRIVAGAAAAFGRLDILINMASVYVSRAFDDLTAADWNATLDVDLRAAFLCARAAVPHMRRTGGGRIVNFSDWTAASRRPRYRSLLPYYVAKAGVIALTEALALELAADNILVNAIAPGPIVAPPSMTATELSAVVEATPAGRWGGAGEVAKGVLALLDGDFITGETLRIDGGRHVK